MPTPEKVDAKLAEFEEALGYRSAGDRAVFKARMKRLQGDLDQARQGGAVAKVVERFERLCALVDETKNIQARLEPPKREFDELIQTGLRLIGQITRVRPELNIKDLEENIRTQQQAGDRAAQDMDQPAYTEACQMLAHYSCELYKVVHQEIQAFNTTVNNNAAMTITRYIGINLGTNNSSMVVMDLTGANIIMHQDRLGMSTIPSCVWYDPRKNKIVVGRKAFRRRGNCPEPIVSINRWMGTNRKVMLGNRAMTPEEISAEILKELRRQIVETLHTHVSAPMDRAVIAIPARFQSPAIEATYKAGKLAGLEVGVIHEPIAAATYCLWKHDITQDCTVLVLDAGGSTFDVSILRRIAGEFETLGVSGDTLGGDDFDRRLAEMIRQRLVEDDYELDLDVEHDPEDAMRFMRLVLLAEGVKKRLTDNNKELLRASNALTDKAGDHVVIEMMITREEFENEVRDLVTKMLSKCWEALAKAYEKTGTTLKDVDHILLVGGTSYVPLIQKAVRISLCDCENPRELGATDVNEILEQIGQDQRETVRHLIGLGERARCQSPIFEASDTCNARGAAIHAALAGLGYPITPTQNPFALLRISTEATRQEVVERGKELIGYTNDQDLKIYRKAVEQIICHPFNRLVQAAWEMPDTDYEDHDDLYYISHYLNRAKYTLAQ